MGDVADKLAYFQAITGIEDADLCTEILSAHDWDLELAISSITSTDGSRRPSSSAADAPTTAARANQEPQESGLYLAPNGNNQPPGLAWKLVTLPFSIISGGLGLISGAIGFGMWAAGGVLSYSLGMVGLNSASRAGTTPLVTLSQSASEAMDFVAGFERDYGHGRVMPRFVTEGFMDALQRSRHEYKLLFVYLHSPEHPDTPAFCEGTLCNEILAAFLNENFVAWGGSVKASEGFKMSNSLKASRYPFCAVVMAATNQRIALLQQMEKTIEKGDDPTLIETRLDKIEKGLESVRDKFIQMRHQFEKSEKSIDRIIQLLLEKGLVLPDDVGTTFSVVPANEARVKIGLAANQTHAKTAPAALTPLESVPAPSPALIPTATSAPLRDDACFTHHVSGNTSLDASIMEEEREIVSRKHNNGCHGKKSGCNTCGKLQQQAKAFAFLPCLSSSTTTVACLASVSTTISATRPMFAASCGVYGHRGKYGFIDRYTWKQLSLDHWSSRRRNKTKDDLKHEYDPPPKGRERGKTNCHHPAALRTRLFQTAVPGRRIIEWSITDATANDEERTNGNTTEANALKRAGVIHARAPKVAATLKRAEVKHGRAFEVAAAPDFMVQIHAFEKDSMSRAFEKDSMNRKELAYYRHLLASFLLLFESSDLLEFSVLGLQHRVVYLRWRVGIFFQLAR